jgi:hypothetical protein
MVGQGNTPPKLPLEVITDTLASLQKDVQRQGEHLTTLAGSLTILQDTIQRGHRRMVRTLWGLAGGMLLCTGVILSWTQSAETYNTVFVGVDTVLVDTWKSLPKAVQEQLSVAYRAGQMRAPGDRQ